MTDYLPQSYPLWCAELHGDGSVSVGRVIGWHLDGQVPEVIWEDVDSGRLLNGVSGAHPGNPLFLAETRDRAATLASRAHGETQEPDPLDYAMFTVWLEGNWRWVTKKMTTEAREAAIAAVLRYDAAMKGDEPNEDLLDRSSLAWWD